MEKGLKNPITCIFQISFSTNYYEDHFEANVSVNLTAMLVIATLFISVSSSYVFMKYFFSFSKLHIVISNDYLGCLGPHQSRWLRFGCYLH